MTNSMENDKAECYTVAGITTSHKIISEYFHGDWYKFFQIWSTEIPGNVKKLSEYKILTFKLRVHFAILPIRIIQLHQNNNCELNKSSKVNSILKNFADKLNLMNNKNEDFEEEENKLTLNSMKQLENFLNSEDGQKLAEELKDSSHRIVFALPYIIKPYKDESMKNIFSIDWLKELTEDLEKFITMFLQYFPSKQPSESKYNEDKILEDRRNFRSSSRVTESAMKNKQVEDWIANHQNVVQDGHMVSKYTQTKISDVRNNLCLTISNEVNNSSIKLSNEIDPANQYNNDLSVIKSRLFSIHKHYKKLKLRFHQLHEDYQKMNEIAEELTLALETSVRGKPVNLETILQTCTKIFPDRFDRDIQTDSEDTSFDLKEDLSENTIVTKKDFEPVNDILVSPETLDYSKIKNHLKKNDSRTKLLLLQALRQKLTVNEVDHRNKTIFEYTKHDLLEVQDYEITPNSNVLLNLLQAVNSDSSVNLVQQSASRFLNAIASFNTGRTYLTCGPTVLNMIINYLNSCNNGTTDGITLDMLVATLQKMSLRKQQREYMIEANLVEWLIHHLNNEKSKMGTYRIEHVCALLMNLSLHSDARSRAAKIAPLLVSIMTSLLTVKSTSTLPYLNGVLQNFLLNNEINSEAKKINLTEILEYHCMKCNQELRPHFLHTLKIHKRECNENLSDDEFPDEDNDTFDILEKELEQQDPIDIEPGEFRGEYLLVNQYCISNFSLDSKEYVFKRSGEPINSKNYCLQTRESKKIGLNASMINAASETTLDDFKTETTEKKSGTGKLVKSRKFPTFNKDEEKSANKKYEDPFLAKPKLMRTPPDSARMLSNQSNKFKRIRNKVR